MHKHFPRFSQLHKIFNRNTAKIEYRYANNTTEIIKSITEKLTRKSPAQIKLPCNCRANSKWPLNGNCLHNHIFQATVKLPISKENISLGETEGQWKQKNNTDKTSLTNSKYTNSTILSNHIWEIKDKNIMANDKYKYWKQI